MNEGRAKRYDINVDLWHPNRHKMVDIALEILPYRKRDQLRALDLGIGTEFFTKRFLERYPALSADSEPLCLKSLLGVPLITIWR